VVIHPNHLRAAHDSRRPGSWLACCLVLSLCGAAAWAQTETTPDRTAPAPAIPAPAQPAQNAPAQPGGAASAAAETLVVALGTHNAEPPASKRHLREAEDAYLAGAKKLQHDDLTAAESDFQRALKLDPQNRNYAIAISVARQHRLAELVQHATAARQAGDAGKADALFAEARAIDPDNPIVVEHSGQFLVSSASAPPGREAPDKSAASAEATPLANRTRMLAGNVDEESGRIQAPVLAGAIRLAPSDAVKSFELRGVAADVLRNVASGYGINAVIDDSVEQRNVHFALENVTYQQAMNVLMQMTHAFAVPLDERTLLVARDDPSNRQRLERQVEETIDLPGYTTDQLNDMSTLMKTVFGVKQINVQTSAGNIVVRAPEEVLDPMNRTLRDLIAATGEVMVEVKLYEVDTTRMTNAGATIPNGFGVFNVQAAAATLVSQNQALVQQAIAQGLISATASNLEIAAALLASGLVQSSLLSSTVGVFGHGLTQTGITETGSVSLNLGLNTSDTRTLDDVQIRVGDRQAATFREGTRYPIVSSTYTTGLSTAASALSNASINGVSVASLLSQYAGGTSTTIPQVTYEDLGVTLKATPIIQRSGRISMTLDLKIESLSGSTSDGNPILNSRQFASDLTVQDGDSALMVSAVSKTETAAMTGIPGLSELPGFQMPIAANVQKNTTQLVVVVTPHIVRRPPDLFMGPRVPIGPLTAN
jgi:general secretion pathway protein D